VEDAMRKVYRGEKRMRKIVENGHVVLLVEHLIAHYRLIDFGVWNDAWRLQTRLIAEVYIARMLLGLLHYYTSDPLISLFHHVFSPIVLLTPDPYNNVLAFNYSVLCYYYEELLGLPLIYRSQENIAMVVRGYRLVVGRVIREKLKEEIRKIKERRMQPHTQPAIPISPFASLFLLLDEHAAAVPDQDVGVDVGVGVGMRVVTWSVTVSAEHAGERAEAEEEDGEDGVDENDPGWHGKKVKRKRSSEGETVIAVQAGRAWLYLNVDDDDEEEGGRWRVARRKRDVRTESAYDRVVLVSAEVKMMRKLEGREEYVGGSQQMVRALKNVIQEARKGDKVYVEYFGRRKGDHKRRESKKEGMEKEKEREKEKEKKSKKEKEIRKEKKRGAALSDDSLELSDSDGVDLERLEEREREKEQLNRNIGKQFESGYGLGGQGEGEGEGEEGTVMRRRRGRPIEPARVPLYVFWEAPPILPLVENNTYVPAQVLLLPHPENLPPPLLSYPIHHSFNAPLVESAAFTPSFNYLSSHISSSSSSSSSSASSSFSSSTSSRPSSYPLPLLPPPPPAVIYITAPTSNTKTPPPKGKF
jgi:hypothetical protein